MEIRPQPTYIFKASMAMPELDVGGQLATNTTRSKSSLPIFIVLIGAILGLIGFWYYSKKKRAKKKISKTDQKERGDSGVTYFSYPIG